MTILNQSAIYNLNAVLMETGLKADVLRAWEKRYDLPKPQRTAGGHRLYSAYDIEIIKWLKARQAEGLSISRAVDLWKEMLNAGINPFEKYPNIEKEYRIAENDDNSRIENLKNNWLDACMKFDGKKAEEILNQAFALYPVETVCVEVLQRGLHLIGESWHQGKTAAQQEHFASALAARRLEALITATPAPTRKGTILVGCPPEELHTFPLLMLSLFLQRKGYTVIYLGADIPFEQVRYTAEMIKPNVIVMAAQQLTTAATLQAVANSLKPLGIPFAFGGLIFNRIPTLDKNISGIFLGENLENSLQLIERLLVDPTSLKFEIGEVKQDDELANVFRRKRAVIENEIADSIDVEVFNLNSIMEVNAFFGSRLSAALFFNDLSLLSIDLDWVKELLAARNIDQTGLDTYLEAYQRLIEETLGEAGRPIWNWIDSYRNNLMSQI